MTALTGEAASTISPPFTTQQSNWTVNKTEADYTEGPIALKFSHPCLEDHHSYCINGVCAFHHELEKAICRCFTGYTGERCEHLTLTSYAADSYEKYIAIGIGVGLLLSGFLVIFYCYIRKSSTIDSEIETEEPDIFISQEHVETFFTIPEYLIEDLYVEKMEHW
ncbi:hypothetical protein E5288_WYG019216 [Bos mutus]|uniref:Epigen n=1 Tax=Bos mutus TaxID=72004 RepID=A0A6B0RXV1_9CETA|nr:hypothetical protein [Bos mutus]